MVFRMSEDRYACPALSCFNYGDVNPKKEIVGFVQTFITVFIRPLSSIQSPILLVTRQDLRSKEREKERERERERDFINLICASHGPSHSSMSVLVNCGEHFYSLSIFFYYLAKIKLLKRIFYN
jgi:hypothetical protein